ncbi:MAG TPA: hypothetical protein VHB99_09720, partial [Pirellulales bacterium]|nr:hypothetical protein [Pirellulales bacterium]
MSVSSVAGANVFPSAGNPQTFASASGSDFATVLAATRSAEAASATASSTASTPNAAGGILVDTSAGKQTISPEDYFTPPERGGNSFHSLPPLLLPSIGNVQALSSDASAK